jgi:hypothetical protein
MRDQLLQFGLVAAFGALCFGCGCLTAFIVTRNQWRGDMIERGFCQLQRADGQVGMGRASK